MSFKIHCSLPALAAPADTGFLFLFPCICHWFSLSIDKVFLGTACISEVKWASLVYPSAICGRSSLPGLRNLMKRWNCQTGHCVSDAALLCLSQSCAALSQGPAHVFARHRGVAYHCWAGASVPGFAYFVLDGENGQICK